MPFTCNCHERTHDGSFPLMFPHFVDCPEFGPCLRELIEQLVRGIETWGQDADGIHEAVWQAYSRAKLSLGEPVEDCDAP